MSTACLWLAVLLGQTAPVVHPSVQLLVDMEPRLVRVGAEVLDVELLVAALRLRLARAPVQIGVGEDPGAAAWQLRLVHLDVAQVRVTVADPAGDQRVELVLSTRRRRPRDLVNTVALVTVEALVNAMPELLARALDAPSDVSHGPVVATPPAALAQPAAPSVRVTVAAGPVVGTMLPTGDVTWGARAHADVTYRQALASMDVGWWKALRRRDDAYHVAATQLTARVGAGGVWQVDTWRLWGQVGPALRRVHLDAGGSAITVRRAALTDWGVSAQLGVGVALGPMTTGIMVDATRYARHPRLVVEGERVLNLGYATLEAGVFAAFGFSAI